MNDDRPPGGYGTEAEDPAAGEPTGVLGGFAQEMPPGFMDRVRNKIHRRVLAADVADLSWRAPAMLFMQWLLIVIDLVRGGFRTQGGRPDE